MVQGNGTNAVGGEGVPEGLLSSPEARARARSLVAKAQQLPDQLGQVNERFAGFVREQPLLALGAALGIGYVLGRAFRRVF